MDGFDLRVREVDAADQPGIDALMEAQMAGDDVWPPRYARLQNHGAWLAERADVGRWVALEGERIIAHVGVSAVRPGDRKIPIWRQKLGHSDDRLAEIGRLVVHPERRRSHVSGVLTRRCVRATVSAGYVPVASAFESSTASLAMMQRLGWEIAGSVTGHRSGRTIVLLVAPQQLVEAARRASTAQPAAAPRNDF